MEYRSSLRMVALSGQLCSLFAPHFRRTFRSPRPRPSLPIPAVDPQPPGPPETLNPAAGMQLDHPLVDLQGARAPDNSPRGQRQRRQTYRAELAAADGDTPPPRPRGMANPKAPADTPPLRRVRRPSIVPPPHTEAGSPRVPPSARAKNSWPRAWPAPVFQRHAAVRLPPPLREWRRATPGGRQSSP